MSTVDWAFKSLVVIIVNCLLIAPGAALTARIWSFISTSLLCHWLSLVVASICLLIAVVLSTAGVWHFNSSSYHLHLASLPSAATNVVALYAGVWSFNSCHSLAVMASTVYPSTLASAVKCSINCLLVVAFDCSRMNCMTLVFQLLPFNYGGGTDCLYFFLWRQPSIGL